MRNDTRMTTPAATTILALDLGKFKSVACVYDHASGTHQFQTIGTSPSAVHDLLVEVAPMAARWTKASPSLNALSNYRQGTPQTSYTLPRN